MVPATDHVNQILATQTHLPRKQQIDIEHQIMRPKTNNSQANNIFANNLLALIGQQHTLTSLSRDLRIHRNQLQRFVDGQSFPRPDILLRICAFFDVDVRILTHPLQDIGVSVQFPPYLIDAFEPAPVEKFPDGFFEEWRELRDCRAQYARQLMHVRTVSGVRQTKVIVCASLIGLDGDIIEVGVPNTFGGVALRQAGGLCIIDRPDHNTGLTFTALRSGCYGNNALYSGHKRSVRGALGEPHPMKAGVAMRYLAGGFAEALAIRRTPRFRTVGETPELIQALLRDQHANADFC